MKNRSSSGFVKKKQRGAPHLDHHLPRARHRRRAQLRPDHIAQFSDESSRDTHTHTPERETLPRKERIILYWRKHCRPQRSAARSTAESDDQACMSLPDESVPIFSHLNSQNKSDHISVVFLCAVFVACDRSTVLWTCASLPPPFTGNTAADSGCESEIHFTSSPSGPRRLWIHLTIS